MKTSTLLLLATMFAVPVQSLAQAGGAPNSGAAGRQPEEGVLTRDTLSQSDLKRLAEQIEQWNRVDAKDGVTPRVARARTAAMLGALKVACVVADASYRGPAPDGHAQHVYEASCKDGLGYLLMLNGSELTGSSCLAAGREGSPMACTLPANSDGRNMAAIVLNRQHVQCKVRDLRWLGSSAANLDYIEAVCETGGGYVLRRPPIGAGGDFEVVSCEEAGKQGVACALSSPASSPAAADSRPNLAWFKEKLNQNGVACQAKRARIVGRESVKRRYLVEFECADRPDGLIAFVPQAGDTANPFESFNCAAAAQRGIQCEWVKP